MLKVNDTKIRLAKATGALLRPDLHPLNKQKNFGVYVETTDLPKNSPDAEELHTLPPEDDHNKPSFAYQQSSLLSQIREKACKKQILQGGVILFMMPMSSPDETQV